MITYQIDRAAGLVTCRVTSNLDVLEVADFVGQLFADANFDVNFNTLVIVADETMAPDLCARNGMAEFMLAWRRLHMPSKWAFVLPDSSAWRRLGPHVIEDYSLGTKNVRCFTAVSAALEWFHEPVPVA